MNDWQADIHSVIVVDVRYCAELKTTYRQGGSRGSPPLGGLDSENFIVESVVHTAELDVFFNHL